MTKLIAGFCLAAAAVALAGCGTPAPREQLGAARNAVKQAELSEAPALARLELRNAQTKLAAAEAAFRNNDNLRARLLAEQATVDAELALSRAEAEIAERNAAQMRRSVEAIGHGAATAARPEPMPAPSGVRP